MKTLNNGKKRMTRITEVVGLTMAVMTMPVFADATNVGQNTGQWLMEQIWYVALAAVAFVACKFLIKRAWMQCGLFVVIGGLILAFIKNPEKLSIIGDALFNKFFQ